MIFSIFALILFVFEEEVGSPTGWRNSDFKILRGYVHQRVWFRGQLIQFGTDLGAYLEKIQIFHETLLV